MINLLKPAREIFYELNRLEEKTTQIIIHGIGKVKYPIADVVPCIRRWRFMLTLDNGICIKCSANYEDFELFEDGDLIEFWGTLDTHNYPRYTVSSIYIRDARLVEEDRCFSDVFMWNIKISPNLYPESIFNVNKLRYKASQIAYISLDTLENLENKWVYGHLVKNRNGVILQLDKIME